MANSTRGYCQEIFLEQDRHFPFKKIKLIKGKLSYHLILVKHLGQYERPKIVSSLKRRQAKQLIKLPINRPKIKEITGPKIK